MTIASLLSGASAIAAQRLDVAATAPIDRPVPVRVTSLAPGSVVAVRTIAIDDRGQRWTASAIYRADAFGTIDVERDDPLSASYEDVGRGSEGGYADDIAALLASNGSRRSASRISGWKVCRLSSPRFHSSTSSARSRGACTVHPLEPPFR